MSLYDTYQEDQKKKKQNNSLYDQYVADRQKANQKAAAEQKQPLLQRVQGAVSNAATSVSNAVSGIGQKLGSLFNQEKKLPPAPTVDISQLKKPETPVTNQPGMDITSPVAEPSAQLKPNANLFDSVFAPSPKAQAQPQTPTEQPKSNYNYTLDKRVNPDTQKEEVRVLLNGNPIEPWADASKQATNPEERIKQLNTPTTISAAPKQTVIDKVKDFITKPFRMSDEQITTKAQVVYNAQGVLAEKLNVPRYQIPLTYVDKNFDNVAEQLGFTTDKKKLENAMGIAMVGGLALGVSEAGLVVTTVGFAGFMAISKAVDVLSSGVQKLGMKVTGGRYQPIGGGEGGGLAGLLPEGTNEGTQMMVQFIEMLGEGKALHSMYTKSPALFDKVTTNITETYNLPKTMEISPNDLRSFYAGLEGLDPAKFEALKKIGIPDKRTALANGVKIEVPWEKVVTITDKPYWAKIKQFFRVPVSEPKTTTTSFGQGGVSTPIAGMLTAGEATPFVPEVVSVPDALKTQVENSNLQGTPLATELLAKIEEANKLGKNIKVINVELPTGDPNELKNPTPQGKNLAVEFVDRQVEIDDNGNPVKAPEKLPAETATTVEPLVPLKDQQPDLSKSLNKSDYENILKPKIDALPELKPGEVAVIQSGTGKWVDTQIDSAISRGINANTQVKVVPASELTLTDNPQKDLLGERWLKTPTETMPTAAAEKPAPISFKGYTPHEPTYYQEGGKPPAVADIAATTEPSTESVKEIIRGIYPRVKTQADAIAYYKEQLKIDSAKYLDYVNNGLKAVHEPTYGNPEGVLNTALSLTHNHIVWDVSHLKALGSTDFPQPAVEANTPGSETPPPPETAVKTPPTEKKVQKPAAKIKAEAPDKAHVKIIPKRPQVPVIGGMMVNNGVATSTNLDVWVSSKSPLKTGWYQRIGEEWVSRPNMPVDEMPVMPTAEKPAFEMLGSDFAEMVKEMAPAASDDESRPVLQTINLMFDKGGAMAYTTDGFRLFRDRFTNMKVLAEPGTNLLLSFPDELSKVAPILSGSKVSVNTGDAVTSIAGAESTIAVRTIEGNFPDVTKVIPNNLKGSYTFNADEMLKVLKELAPYSKQNSDIVSITLSDGEFSIEAGNADLNKKLPVKVTKTDYPEIGIVPDRMGMVMPVRLGDLTQLGFRNKYLVDMINQLGTGDVSMSFSMTDGKMNTQSGMVFTDGGAVTAGKLPPVPEELAKEALEYPTANNFSFVAIHKYGMTLDEATTVWNQAKKGVIEEPAAKPKMPSGEASAGAQKIGEFESVQGTEATNFKLHEKVKELIDKYAKTVGESYLPRNALGVYYTDTANIRVTGMNDLSVAAHEITHFLDHKYNITDQLMGVIKTRSDGKPIYDKETLPFRKGLTDVFEKYYPGGSRDKPLRKRLVEGYATLLQKYTEMPQTINQEFPQLVNDFLMEGGKFYQPVIGEILKDLKGIVSDYQGLDPLDKIGARVTSDGMPTDKKSFLKFTELLRTEIADNVYPLEVLAKKAGIHFTVADPSLWVRAYNNYNATVLNNIAGNRGYWAFDGQGFSKKFDYNWKTLTDHLGQEKTSDSFANYLVARDQYFNLQEIKKMEAGVETLKQSIAEAGGAEAAAQMIGDSGKSLWQEYKDAAKALRDEKAVFDRNGWTEKEITDAYELNKDRFKKEEDMFDNLTRADLDFLHHSAVGLVDGERYAKLTQKEGYASLKRQFYDEIVGEAQDSFGNMRVGKTKVSSLIARKGSSRTIINPVASGIANHREIVRKALKQIVYNKLGNIASSAQFPELFQKLSLKAVPDRATGVIHFPQEKDPNIIMARINYKRVPILTDSIVKRTVDEVLNTQNMTTFEQLLLGMSRMFTKGTTGLYPGFAFTNITQDQVTAAINTRNKMTPMFSPLATFTKAITNKSGRQYGYLMEYLVMGGEKQTFVNWQDLTPNELFKAMKDEKAGILKAVDAINKGVDILALPSKWSEIITRSTEYIKARQAGKPQVVALEEAGRVTAPFHHIGRLGGGTTGKTYVKSIPFFNPSIQVLDQVLRTASTPKGRARYGFVVMATTAAMLASLGIIATQASDEQKDLYKDLQASELSQFLYFPSPDGKTLIRVKLAREASLFGVITNMSISNAIFNTKYDVGDFLLAGSSMLPEQFQFNKGLAVALDWTPQFIRPAIEVGLNKKTFPKVLPIESDRLQRIPAGLRYTESTTAFAKFMGEKLNISPVKIDYLMTGYFGRAAGFIAAKPGIYNPFSSLVRSYYFTSGRRIQDYYDQKTLNDQEYKAMNDKLKTVTIEERRKINQNRFNLKRVGDLLDQYDKIDIEKNPERAALLRTNIFEALDKLQK